MAYVVATLPGGDLFIRQSGLAFYVTANHAGPFVNTDGESRPEAIAAMPLHSETDMYGFELTCSDGQKRTFDIPRNISGSATGGVTILNS